MSATTLTFAPDHVMTVFGMLYRADLDGMLTGLPLFTDIRRV